MPAPITPDEGPGGAGAWPRPRLSKRATAMGLNYTQWAYVLAGYALWDGGQSVWTELLAPLALPVPWSAERGHLVWSGVCLLVTAASVLYRWHGLHAYRAWQRVWASATAHPLSVWKPVGTDDQERAAAAAEEEDHETARRRAAHRTPVAGDANPLGWIVD